jgi:hypothetical protein
MTEDPRDLNLDEDALAALEVLKDEYAARLIKQVIAQGHMPQDRVTDVSADDLRAAAAGRLSLDLILRTVAGFGLLMLLAGAAVFAFALLPEAVHGTSARIGLGLGLLGALVASLAGLGLHFVRQVGADAVLGWVQQRQSDSDPPELAARKAGEVDH